MLDLTQTIPGRIVQYLLTKTVHIIISHITVAICCIEILQFNYCVLTQSLYKLHSSGTNSHTRASADELVCTTAHSQ